MNRIEGVFIAQDDEKYAPPEQDLLFVTAVQNTAYLEIGAYEEDNKKREFIYKAQVAVPLDQLIYTLELLQRAEQAGKKKDD